MLDIFRKYSLDVNIEGIHDRIEIRLKKRVANKPKSGKDFYHISIDKIPEELNKKYVN